MSDCKILPSRNGSAFMSLVEIEPDGSLSILSNDGKGSRSAHRDHARKHFGKGLQLRHRLIWINLNDVRVVSTTWSSANLHRH